MTDQDNEPGASPLARLIEMAALALVLALAGGIGVGLLASGALVRPPVTPAASQPAIAWPPAATDPLQRDTAVTPVRDAPPLPLTDQDGRPFDLATLRGTPVLVFFGYTHCPDVCPTTLADVRDALKASPVAFRVVFVTVDPARDDPASLREYLALYQAGFIGLTGTEAQVRAAADAWGVQYARIDSDSASGYSMAHTADAFLLDAAGRLRHRIWFGAGPIVIDDRVARLAAEPMPSFGVPSAPVATPRSPAPTALAGGSPAPEAEVVAVLATTVIRVGNNRLVVTTSDPANHELARPDTAAHFTFRSAADPSAAQIEGDGAQIWVSVGTRGAFVVDASFPAAGSWNATVTLSRDGTSIGTGAFGLTVKERGSTPAVGDPAPVVRTPTAADANGELANITTDVFPDARFYDTSVDALLAAHRPFVLTFYSPAFCPTTACGPLLKNMKTIANEFPEMAFVHVEPYVMSNYGMRLVPDWSTGKLQFNDQAKAYGIPVDPFVFVIDGDGKVAASFELIVGMDEVRAAIRAAQGRGA